MKYLLLSLLLLVSSASHMYAQLLPPLRAEQDACNALEICGNKFTTLYSYQGNGMVLDLASSPCATNGGFPPGAGEDNAVWLKLKIVTSGAIVFKIMPIASTDDYDWAVLDITNKSCSNLSSSDVVRCNYNNNYDSATYQGVTGLDYNAVSTGTGAGVSGGHFLKKIDAIAGQVYLVMVNNFGSGGAGSPSSLGSGFTIDFSGSTAVFNDNMPPKFQAISNICFVGNTVTLDISKDILCSSVAPNGSDFQLSAGGTVVSAAGLNCTNINQGYAHKIDIHFNQDLAPGTYFLKARKGTDNNTLIDLCNNALLLPDSIKFTVYPDQSTTVSVDTAGCGSVVFNGNTYTESVVLHDTIRNVGGCDSIYFTANITVYPLTPSVINTTVGNCDSVTFRGITYTEPATVTDTFKNRLGCDSVLHIYHIVPEHLNITIAADPPEPVIGDYVTLTTSGNVDGYGITSWYPAVLFPNQFALVQSYIIPHSDTIIVIGKSPQGCIDTARLFVKADTLVPVVVMPNAFSPNGDALNDVFEPYFVNKSGYLVKEFKVFDRWGKLIYQASNARKASWSGNYYNQDKPAPTGIYYFFIDVKFVDGTKKYFKGDVTLLR